MFYLTNMVNQDFNTIGIKICSINQRNVACMGGEKNAGHAQLNCLQMHNHMEFLRIATHYLFPIYNSRSTAFCLFQFPCTLFISGAERNFNKVRNCFPKPLLWKWRFDAPTEIRRHSNAFQAFEEIWLCRLSKLNEVKARLISCIPLLHYFTFVQQVGL